MHVGGLRVYSYISSMQIMHGDSFCTELKENFCSEALSNKNMLKFWFKTAYLAKWRALDDAVHSNSLFAQSKD